MGLQPLLGNASNWEHVWSTTKTANVIPSIPPSYDPIPPFFCPLQFESPTVAIWAGTQSPKLTWKSGGMVGANVVTGIVQGGVSTSEIARQWLRLSQVTIFRIPKLADSFSLQFFPPYWFKSYGLEVWQYTGPGNADLESKADLIYDQLTAP